MLARPLLLLTACLACAAAVAPAADPPPAGWRLTWSDEFDGGAVDRAKWDFDTGTGYPAGDGKTWVGGWGNNERQAYTRRPENVFVKDGKLTIRARRERFETADYTSARLKTMGVDGKPLFAQTYGRFEFRAKLPAGKGVWPALWMLPADTKQYGTWAASGEIDVLEAKGHEPHKVHGTLHFGGRWPANAESTGSYTLPDNGTITDFHTYAVEWGPGEVRWLVDNKPVQTKSFWWSTGKRAGGNGAKPANESDLHPWPAPFDRPFTLVMNVAVGGKFPGDPDKTTTMPADMVVDWVRVYDRPGGYGPAKPRGPGAVPFGK